MKIFHFANLSFGLPFLESYSDLSTELKNQLEITVVFSGKKTTRSRYLSLRNLKRTLDNWMMERAYRKKFKNYPFEVLLSGNVNSDSFIQKIASNSLGICSGFNQVFSQKLIDKFGTCVNIHPSLLPYYRGPVPSYWVLKNSEAKTGYTIHLMTSKIDSGEIVYQEQVDICLGDTEVILDRRIAERAKHGIRYFIEAKAEGKAFEKKILNSTDLYQHLVDYKSFPSK